MRSRSIEGVLTAILVLGLCEVAAAAGWTTSTRVRSVDVAIDTLDAPEIAMSGQGVTVATILASTRSLAAVDHVSSAGAIRDDARALRTV